MKKNLIYYVVSIKDEYAELLEKSIESVDLSNEDYIDIVILTDNEYFEKNLKLIKRPNISFFFIEKPKNFDEVCFNKLKIWDYPNLNQYQNILYLDSDILVNKNLNSFFEKCVDDNKLYVAVEDYDISNHNRIQFSLGTYNQEDLDFFQKNNIYTFNAGTFMFKNGVLMKKHFRNVIGLINRHEGPFFTDQSFMNYYFNSYKLTDSKIIVKDLDYKFVVNSNYSEDFDFNDCIMHFITEGSNKNNVTERMSNILYKMRPYSTKYKNNMVDVISIDNSIAKINYTSNFSGLLNIKLFQIKNIIYEQDMEVHKNQQYWTTFDYNWYDKEFHFSDGKNTQVILIEGLSKKYEENFFDGFLIEKDIDSRTELCELFDIFGSDKASKPSHKQLPGHNYSRYYYELFKDLKNDNINLFELGLGTCNSFFKYSMSPYGTSGASLKAWESFFTNGKIFGADIDKEILINTTRIKTFYCDQNDEKIINEMWQNESLNFYFDIIIDDAVHEFDYNVKFLENSLHKLKVGGYYIIEDIIINSIPKWFSYYQKNKSKYENFSFEFVKLNCSHNSYDNNLIVLKRNK